MPEFIIIGGGFAGYFTALRAFDQHIPFLLIEDDTIPPCSLISPAMINPVVFKRITLSWNFFNILESLKKLNLICQKHLGKPYLHEITIYQLLNPQQIKQWQSKQNDDTLCDFYLGIQSIDWFGQEVPVAAVKGWWWNSSGFFSDMKKFLTAHGLLIQQHFDDSQLHIAKNFVQTGPIKASHIIFCRGYSETSGKFFGNLPFKPVGGHLFHLNLKHSLTKHTLYVKDKFLWMTGTNTAIFGSSYIWDLSTENFMLAASSLKKDLDLLGIKDYTITSIHQGIRPSMKDRRPVAGPHPLYPNVLINNGGGTKGTGVYAYTSGILLENLLNSKPIPAEILPSRFKL